MNKTAELVNLWAAFEEKYPKGSLEDFFRYQLISKREGSLSGKFVGGVIPTNTPGLMMKIIGRISRLHLMYSNLALGGTGLNQIEEFGMLITIDLQKRPRKTEVIYDNLMELSSGTDMVNRLIKRGYVTEHSDKEDKRAKRLQLTPAGSKATAKSKEKILQLVDMLTMDMDTEDQLMCIQLLKDLEIKLLARWPKDKGQSIEDIYKDMMLNKPSPKKKHA